MRRNLSLPLALVAALGATACATQRPHAGVVLERGIASWYGPGFHGRFTASGERYDQQGFTAAHPTLPFGTELEIRNLGNGRSVRVRVNDRGPFRKNRVIDLSQAAARALGMIGPGTALVEIAAVGEPTLAPRGFAVQVGAFAAAARAAELAASLCDRYPDVRVRSDAVWHRVQVGAFAARHDAELAAEELAALGLTAVVVPLPFEAAGGR
jgi:rare lipoprotein A